MATWACGHRRQSDFFADAWPGFALAALHEASGPSIKRSVEREIAERQQLCPACAAQSRRLRNGWAALVLVALAVLLIGWRLHG